MVYEAATDLLATLFGARSPTTGKLERQAG